MFGYVIVNKPELKIKEYNRYQAFYCGLCHSLRHKFGIRGQVSLNYDFTFLSILLSALYEPESEVKDYKCIAHPFERRPAISNELIDYAADMSLILTYYKCKDDWQDSKKIGKNIYASQIAKYFRKLNEKYEEKSANIKAALDVLSKLESDKSEDIDKLSGIFGKILAEIFIIKTDEWEKELYNLGFYLGKFIYILDAYDDLEEDKKKGDFNPFMKKCKEDHFEEWIYDILVMAAAQMAKNFEILPVVEDLEILRNIIYSGIWTKYTLIKERRGKDARSISDTGHTT